MEQVFQRQGTPGGDRALTVDAKEPSAGSRHRRAQHCEVTEARTPDQRSPTPESCDRALSTRSRSCSKTDAIGIVQQR